MKDAPAPLRMTFCWGRGSLSPPPSFLRRRLTVEGLTFEVECAVAFDVDVDAEVDVEVGVGSRD